MGSFFLILPHVDEVVGCCAFAMQREGMGGTYFFYYFLQDLAEQRLS